MTDATLTPAFDEGRRHYLAENIRLIDADDERLVHHRVSGATPNFVWMALAATALLGLFMRPQDRLAVTVEWGITVAITVWFWWIIWRNRRLRLQIDRRLNEARA